MQNLSLLSKEEIAQELALYSKLDSLSLVVIQGYLSTRYNDLLVYALGQKSEKCDSPRPMFSMFKECAHSGQRLRGFCTAFANTPEDALRLVSAIPHDYALSFAGFLQVIWHLLKN